MTDFEIINKVFEKAFKNGFVVGDFLKLPISTSASEDEIHCSLVYNGLSNNIGWSIDKGKWSSFVDYQRVIFSHDFAKAFWGENLICNQCKTTDALKHEIWCNFPSNSFMKLPAWQYHLQQMVLEPEPLKYLEKFL